MNSIVRLPIALIKVALVVFFMCLFMLISIVWHHLVSPFRGRWKLTADRAKLVGFFSQIGLIILNIKVNVVGDLESKMGSHLVVSNHLSYLDILIISSRLPACFVTSVEVRNTPFLGLATQLAGCLFVERRNRQNLGMEISEIEEALAEGLRVVIFPEATSTDGSQVLRFRRPLYNAAIRSGSDILPVCINYRRLDCEGIAVHNRDDVYWYGDMSFFSHLWRLSLRNEVEASLHMLPKIAVKPESEDSILAAKSHELVSAAFQPCLT
jgi:1-acyl-sn-glycerol-3-phosphate acyltransferase